MNMKNIRRAVMAVASYGKMTRWMARVQARFRYLFIIKYYYNSHAIT